MLLFKNNAQRKSQKKYFMPTVEIKDYNVMIDIEIFLIILIKVI